MSLPPGFELVDDEEAPTASAPEGVNLPQGFELVEEASPIADLVSTLHTGDVVPPPVPDKPVDAMASYLKRLAKAHVPFPTSMKEVKDLISPSPGKFGMGRFLEEEGKRVGGAIRASGENAAEDFVTLPGVNQFPRAAAAVGATGSAVADLLSDSLTPSAMAQNLGAEVGLMGLKGAELAARARIAEKVSGLPPQVSRAIRENPTFFEETKGTPEAQEAANAALKEIVDQARAGHIQKTTAAREAARPGELGEVEAGVRDIQKVIKEARAKAGQGIQAEKEKLGFKSLEEKAQEIAQRGQTPKLTDEELVRETVRALDPNKPADAGEIEGLVRLRQSIDDRVNFGQKDINPPGTEMSAILKKLRAKINERLGGPMEADLETFPMPEGEPRPPAGFGPGAAEQPFGAPLRAAETEFSRVAKITDPLAKKFETVPKGVSSVKTSMQEGLRSVDPELRALEELSGGKEALSRAEIAESRFLEGEKTFKESLKSMDPMAGRFETAPKGMDTMRNVMREGTEAIDPDMKAIKEMPGGEEALTRLKAEVNRFDADRVDVQPTTESQLVAQVIGITPARAARLLSQAVNAGPFPGLSRVATILTKAASRGPEALATTNFLLQQQDDEYRRAVQALQQGGEN